MTPRPASAKASADHPVAGIAWMLAGVGIFCINDALGKWLVVKYPVGELLLIRSAAALIVLIPFLCNAGVAAFVAAPRPMLQVARIVVSAFEVAMFFLAVSYLPLADVSTFYLATPIYVTVLSAPLLGERTGWRRGTAVAAGFVGVVLALRPSPATFTMPALIAVGGSLFFAVLLVTTRLLRNTAQMVLISGQLVATLMLGAVSAAFGWVAPPLLDFLLLVLFGVLSVVALACVNHALRLAPASVIVPYQYTMIIWAVVLGFVVFGDVPDLLTLVGAAIIIAAGLCIFWLERLRR
ncbi:MAG: DMT family transporter [Bradyrhizobiaceae bacterium]|nr:DMT family transporter [Bradyrhizobiaceae bacterium]